MVFNIFHKKAAYHLLPDQLVNKLVHKFWNSVSLRTRSLLMHLILDFLLSAAPVESHVGAIVVSKIYHLVSVLYSYILPYRIHLTCVLSWLYRRYL